MRGMGHVTDHALGSMDPATGEQPMSDMAGREHVQRKVYWSPDHSVVVQSEITVTDSCVIEHGVANADRVEFYLGHDAQRCTIVFTQASMREFVVLAQEATGEVDELRRLRRK